VRFSQYDSGSRGSIETDFHGPWSSASPTPVTENGKPGAAGTMLHGWLGRPRKKAPRLSIEILSSQWSIADSSVAAFDADAFRGLKVGQIIVTATRSNKSGNALLQFINPVPPGIFGTWTGTWEGTNTSHSGSLSVTISGNQFSWIARATWTADGLTYAGASDSGEEQSALSDDPALSTSSIQFIAGYQLPASLPDSRVFTRFFGLQTTASDGNVVLGNSFDGFSYGNGPSRKYGRFI
jgi:hypothetical protein